MDLVIERSLQNGEHCMLGNISSMKLRKARSECMVIARGKLRSLNDGTWLTRTASLLVLPLKAVYPQL